MPGSRTLDALQERVLRVLSSVEPKWVLVGGAARAGFYLHHRTTRDLDLVWRTRERLGELAPDCVRRLKDAGLDVSVVQSGGSFQRLRVTDGSGVVVVDLVAEPGPSFEPPAPQRVMDTSVLVASRHDLLVDKLCALLGRAEVRDLVDVRELLATGGELARALADAPRRDAGFSPLTLAWVLRGLPVARLARAAGESEANARSLETFRDELVLRLTAP